MPAFLIPIIVGAANFLRLPALVSFLAGVFGSIVAFFAKWLTANLAMRLTVIASITSLTGLAFLALKALIDSLIVITPDFFAQAASMVIPDNAPLCISAVFSAHIVRYIWVWKVHFIELFGSAK